MRVYLLMGAIAFSDVSYDVMIHRNEPLVSIICMVLAVLCGMAYTFTEGK